MKKSFNVAIVGATGLIGSKFISVLEKRHFPLKELKLKKNTLVAGISRNRRSIIPSGNDMIMSGDKVVVITSGLRVNDIADIAE